MANKKKRKRIRVSSAKAKGRSFQQKIRDMFLEIGHEIAVVRTNLSSEEIDEGIESRQMGGAGEDIRFLTPTARKMFPFYIECKAHRTGFNPHKMMEQLLELAPLTPLLFHKCDRGRSLVTLEADVLLGLIKLYYDGKDRPWLSEVL